MKKYWKSIAITMIIVLGLGTFYLQVALASGGNPNFTIKTIEGDKAKAENLRIDGYYSTDTIDENITITQEGSKYMSDYSYWERLNGINHDPMYKRLTTEYRGFMRGKSPWMGSMYEDDSYLAYAAVEYDFRSFETGDFTFNLAVLDKKADKENEFSYLMEGANKVNHASIESVEKVGDELKVFATLFKRTGEEELHLYVFDLNSQELVDDQPLDQIDPSKQQEYETYIRLLHVTDPLAPKDYVVFRKEVLDHSTVEFSDKGDQIQQPEVIESDLVVFNLETEETENLDLPKRLEDKSQVDLFDGENLYFVETDDTGMTIVKYNIDKQEIINELEVEMKDAERLRNFSNMTIKGDKLYLLLNDPASDTTPKIYALNTETGETVFEGEVTAEDLPEKYNLEIYEFIVQ
ncbi:hypothetical protein JNUCC1_02194 [Lentibacillus sp. JNUCC-1]|uniref:hypothetical protein n=1 Tax=Lentibacillus sp. JNUCC-1 TaxID=2654513 RepID=UPI0012E978CB|nr:hypothetical protein [Lentibacillus sp. JNUCC-1]MUV38356.1 hypothetical protein [Lentibacillus sp. JNUCC-1]